MEKIISMRLVVNGMETGFMTEMIYYEDRIYHFDLPVTLFNESDHAYIKITIKEKE